MITEKWVQWWGLDVKGLIWIALIRLALCRLSALCQPALLHALLFSGSQAPSLIQLSLTAEELHIGDNFVVSFGFGDTMAGATMSALTNCGLQRGVVHHSLVTGSFKANDVSACSVSFPAVHCSWEGRDSRETVSTSETLRNAACGLCLSLTLATALPSLAAQSSQVRLPPLSSDPDRCVRAFVGNTIGQANGVADKVLDLRKCDFSNDVTNLKGKTLSSALMSDAKFDDADLTEVVMSKAYAVGASFKRANFRNAVVDRVAFDKSDMQGVQFINTVLSGSTFDGANLEGASFENALIGYVDIQKLCRNPTLPEESRIDLACKP